MNVSASDQSDTDGKSMRRIIYLMLGLVLSAPLYSANVTSSLVLKGMMIDKTSIEVVDTTRPGEAQLDLTRGTNGYEAIGYLIERSNSTNGYTVRMSSENNYRLKCTNPAIDHIIYYELQYDNNVGDVGITSTGSFWTGDLVYTITNASGPTPEEGYRKVMKIKYSDPSGAPAGTYTDTLYFTITAK